MDTLTLVFLIYLAAINIFAVIITVYDKGAAVKGKRRIRERTLLFVAILGGGFCMYLTMLLIRHKTRRLKFMWGIPLTVIAQALAAVILVKLYG